MGAVRSGEEPGSSPCARDDKVGWDRGISMGETAGLRSRDLISQTIKPKTQFSSEPDMRGSGLISRARSRQLGDSASVNRQHGNQTLEETAQPGFGTDPIPRTCSTGNSAGPPMLSQKPARGWRLQRSTTHLGLACSVKECRPSQLHNTRIRVRSR